MGVLRGRGNHGTEPYSSGHWYLNRVGQRWKPYLCYTVNYKGVSFSFRAVIQFSGRVLVPFKRGGALDERGLSRDKTPFLAPKLLS